MSTDTGSCSGRRPKLLVVLAAALYLMAACLLYWPVAPWNGSQVLNHANADPVQTVWFLQWAAWSVAHGVNPLFSNYLDVPHGANIASNTSVLLLGVVGAPITWLSGAITTFNIFMRLALAGSAFTMFLVLRRWTSWWPAAFLGGALFGFSSFELQESLTHLHLVFLVLVPLLVWAFDELFVTQTRPAWRAGLWLAVLAVAQWFLNEEVLFDCFLFAAIGLVVLAVARPGAAVAHLRRAAGGLLTAVGVFLAVIAYPLWFVLRGPEHLIGPTLAAWRLAGYRMDAFAPFVRTIHETTRATPAIVLAEHPTSTVIHWSASAGYVGIPLVVLLLVLAAAWWRTPLLRFASFMAAVTYFLALGGHLTVLGHNTDVPLPGGIFEHIPLVDEVLPNRFAFLMWLFLAVVLAVGLDRSHNWLVGRGDGIRPSDDSRRATRPGVARLAAATRRRPLMVTVASILVVLASLAPTLVGAPRRRPAPVMDAEAARMIGAHTPSGGVVLYLPEITSSSVTPMLWQAESDMEYRTVGGYATVPENRYTSQPTVPPSAALAAVYAVLPYIKGPDRRHVATDAQMVAACRAPPTVLVEYNVQSIVVWPGPQQEVKAATKVLTTAFGPTRLRSSRLLMWAHVRSLHRRSPTACSKLA